MLTKHKLWWSLARYSPTNFYKIRQYVDVDSLYRSFPTKYNNIALVSDFAQIYILGWYTHVLYTCTVECTPLAAKEL
jgi:hypothetical protein